jgi:uncharacterized protein (TIGR02271 family)
MTQATQRSTVVGVFRDRSRAEEAVDALHRAGFRDDQIGFAAREGEAPEGSEAIAEGHEGGEAGEGAAKGAVGGGIIGGILGALATGLIPGVGPIIAGGLLAGIVGGVAIGAAGGGLLGALTGSMGVPEEEARYYDEEFRSGRTLVTVKADGRYDEAQRILRQYDAYDVQSQDGGTAAGTTERERFDTTGATSRTGATEGTVQLREEELRTRKESVETGQVSLGKQVVEEQKSLEVPVTREEVYVERRAVDRPADRPIDEASRTIEVPVREERVDVEKQPVVYEEVGVRKQEVVENQPVSETVHREELRVDKEGDVNLSGATGGGGTTSWETAMPTYRQRWQQRSGTTGGRWEDVEAGYRYGWEMRNRPEYRGRSWTDIESEAQRDWTTRNPNTPWDRARESVREGWETE